MLAGVSLVHLSPQRMKELQQLEEKRQVREGVLGGSFRKGAEALAQSVTLGLEAGAFFMQFLESW